MFKRFSFLLLLSVVPLFAADAPDPALARLREGLRNTMLQLRDAQTQLAAAQAAQADSDQKNKTLAAQIEALTKQGGADRDAAKKTIASLTAQAADQGAQIAQLKESLAKWKAAQAQASTRAAAKEADRAKLAAANIVLQRTVDERETQNIALYKLGNEILSRYEKFGLGEALLAREPFTGIARVKLQTLVQDYRDKILDQKSKP